MSRSWDGFETYFRNVSVSSRSRALRSRLQATSRYFSSFLHSSQQLIVSNFDWSRPVCQLFKPVLQQFTYLLESLGCFGNYHSSTIEKVSKSVSVLVSSRTENLTSRSRFRSRTLRSRLHPWLSAVQFIIRITSTVNFHAPCTHKQLRS